jgi:hemolysin activation/secretion protein
MAETVFTLADALNAQKALRETAGGQEEPLELIDLVGIGADEIDLLQEQGKSWEEIAALIQKATGKSVSADEVEQAYANLEEDGDWEDD